MDSAAEFVRAGFLEAEISPNLSLKDPFLTPKRDFDIKFSRRCKKRDFSSTSRGALDKPPPPLAPPPPKCKKGGTTLGNVKAAV